MLLEVSDGGVDTMQRLKRIMGWMSFVIFLIVGWGQLLSTVGWIFLVMALLVCPGAYVHQIVDDVLSVFSERWLCMLVLFL